MKFITSIFITSAICASTYAAPNIYRRDVDPNLVPQFGLQSGLNPTGTGDCDGINGPDGKPIKIPCFCPPDRQSFIDSLNANVAAGHVVKNPSISVSFPTDNSQASQLARLQTAIVTLQNLRGSGEGCPAASTTFLAQQKAIQDGAAPPPAASPAAPATAASAPAAGGVDPSLVPDFGVQQGVNPTGTGDCDGINGIKIPCSCPPDRNAFIQSLSADVAAGHMVNNPGIAAPFPTDGSAQSKVIRLQTAISALQNINGKGVGCPAASTTFSAQLAAAIAAAQ